MSIVARSVVDDHGQRGERVEHDASTARVLRDRDIQQAIGVEITGDERAWPFADVQRQRRSEAASP